jgi:hypothetical protein
VRIGSILTTLLIVVTTAFLSIFGESNATLAAASPCPATLVMQRGLTESSAVRPLPWGTELPSSQTKWVTVRSTGPAVEWGVWKKNGGPPEFPVRSSDRGVRWEAAGPLLATDWAGGGIFMVNRVFAEGPSAVVIVSNAVIDVTTDSGHVWYQFVNGADNWSITSYPQQASRIAIRVGPASYANLPKRSFAIYVLDVTGHKWIRVKRTL